MTLEWKESYKLGNAAIDGEHEFAFKLANQFIAAQDKTQQTATAMLLYKHTREHFEREEALMRELGYPDLAAHTERHNQLISRLNEISTSIAQDRVDKQALVNLMMDWAMHHIAQDDAQLALYIAKNRS
jgi:hemerythrin